MTFVGTTGFKPSAAFTAERKASFYEWPLVHPLGHFTTSVARESTAVMDFFSAAILDESNDASQVKCLQPLASSVKKINRSGWHGPDSCTPSSWRACA